MDGFMGDDGTILRRVAMNAAVVESFDAPPRYMSFADPVAGEGETIVNVSATGLHQIVRALARGKHYGSTGVLPMIPGVDGVGRLPDGTRVCFGISRSPYGTFAERTVTARSLCWPAPAGLDDVSIAGMTNPGMSSWAALTSRAQFVAGESVLILGATGTSGQLAVQIAKRLGARRVVAAGRNPQELERVKALGADAVISLNQEHDALVASFRRELAGDGIDVVLDYLWGAPAEGLLEAISQKGLQHASPRIRFVQIGSTAGPTISLPAATLRSSGLELLGSGFGSVSIEKILQSVAEFHTEAAKAPFQTNIKAVSLRDVETLWNSPEQGPRLVFQP
jgi:NADPH:quinone reductase-like Zn-dependent oxidoreductase